MNKMKQVNDIVSVPLSYLYYYHEESKKNPHYTTEGAVKRKDMEYFRLN